MSCDSTTCTPRYDIPASKALGGLEWLWQRPSVWLGEIGYGCERWQRRQLLELDDRLLADIGVSRQDAVEQARRSFWIRMTTWHVYR